MRRLALLLALVAAPAVRAQDSTAYAEDFDAMWSFVSTDYAYPDASPADWPAVRALYRPEALAAPTRGAFIGVLERALAELADAHAHLSTNTANSPRLVPSGADVWAEWMDGRAVVTSVRAGSKAEQAGLRPGATVTQIDGASARAATEALLPRTRRPGDSRADGPALRAALAGTHLGPVRLEAVQDGQTQTFAFMPGETRRPPGLVTAETLPGNVGVVRVLNSLGDDATVAAFDSVLASLRGTRGMVLDLRDTPGGGNTTVARGILSRFVTETLPYQQHERPSEERATGVRRSWVELVSPRGPFTYTAPVVVLVGRWTGSMGEGLAIGFDGTRRAHVVGTPMAGLLGATDGRRLPNTGVTVRVSTERLAHVDGTPREAFVPTPVPHGEGGPDAALAFARRLVLSAGPLSP